MHWLAKLLAPKLIDWLLDLAFKHFREKKLEGKVQKSMEQVEEEKTRVTKAMNQAFNGKPVTKLEKKELRSSAAALMKDY